MKSWVVLLALSASISLWGQTPASSGGCSKNVSFAVAEQGQPVPAIPKFALKWLGGKTRREDFSGLCFSQVPSLTLPNYILVFSTNASAFEGLKPSAHTYKSAPQSNDGTGPVTSYGGTWSYSYSGTAPQTTTDTLDLKRDDKPKAVDVRAFDQSGKTISQGNLTAYSSRDKLLEKVLTDVLHNSPPSVDNRKPFASPLSVYYVNCDVDGQPVSPTLTASLAAPPLPAAQPAPSVRAPQVAPPPPQPGLEIWSSPAGADIFLDGTYVGQTPFTTNVSPGDHVIDLRKKNFAIWQRKVQVTAGKRRIGGNLEQKVLDLH